MFKIDSLNLKPDDFKSYMKKFLIDTFNPCATCGTKCGCIQCAMALPCTCTLICNDCLTHPCICGKPLDNGWISDQVKALGGIITNNVSMINHLTQNITQYFSFKSNATAATTSANQISFTLPKGGCSSGLATGPGFYNPSMLNDGEVDQKLARRRAIVLRNAVLGDACKELYSPQGLRIKSKIWPKREYVFYTHHVSAQVYDDGVNVGRLDVHVPNYDVPMGDAHLATILKTMYDEEEMLKIAEFSPVRDI